MSFLDVKGGKVVCVPALNFGMLVQHVQAQMDSVLKCQATIQAHEQEIKDLHQKMRDIVAEQQQAAAFSSAFRLATASRLEALELVTSSLQGSGELPALETQSAVCHRLLACTVLSLQEVKFCVRSDRRL